MIGRATAATSAIVLFLGCRVPAREVRVDAAPAASPNVADRPASAVDASTSDGAKGAPPRYALHRTKRSSKVFPVRMPPEFCEELWEPDASLDVRDLSLNGAKIDEALCAAALGRSFEYECKEVTATKIREGELKVTVHAEWPHDTMQSRGFTTYVLEGTVRVDAATHAIASANFEGTATTAVRSACEKADACAKCDPTKRSPTCAPACYCPFETCATTTFETALTAE